MNTSPEARLLQPFIRRDAPVIWGEPGDYHFWWRGYIGRICSSVHDNSSGREPAKRGDQYEPPSDYEYNEPPVPTDYERVLWPDMLEEPPELDGYVAEFIGVPPEEDRYEEYEDIDHEWEMYGVTVLWLAGYFGRGGVEVDGAVYWERKEGVSYGAPEDAAAFVVRGLAYCRAPDSPPVEGDEQRGFYAIPEWGLAGYVRPSGFLAGGGE